MTNFRTILLVLATLITLTGAVYGFITYVTPLTEHEALAAEVVQDRIANHIYRIQQQIWAIQNQFGCYSDTKCFQILPPEVKNNYRYLTQELVRLRNKLK